LKRLLYIVPALAFAVLAVALFYGLVRPHAPNELPSVLVNKPVPAVTLPGLDQMAPGLAPADFAQGRVTVLNVWASWCAPCRVEAPLLDRLAEDKSIALFGLVYKDKPANARAFLAEMGNPFSRIGLDASGDAGIEWGIYGVPETFVIDGQGIVRARIVGALTDDGKFTGDLLPAIADAKRLTRENTPAP
jgi:cytochrome c biogenesis protein CcmG/thiol:disulfide interchange protein DsbE